MWQQLILCFILIGSSYQITQAEVDVNSQQHVDMVWSYLQLRPEDIYTTENETTSIRDIATLYYGHAKYTPLILNANPSLEYDDSFIIPACDIEVTLPSVIKCTEFLPLDCIEKSNSHLLNGGSSNLPVKPKPLVSAAPFEGRRLQQAGDVDYLEFDNLPQPLMEQVQDISPLNLKVDIVNKMEVPVWPITGGSSSFIKAGGETSYTAKVSPYDVTSYRFSFFNIFNQNFFVEVSVASAPMPQFPFFHPGEDTSIKVKVTRTINNTLITYYTSPEINPTQGRVSLLTGVGENQANLNITLSIDAQWGRNTARVILEEYYGNSLSGFSNQIRRITPFNKLDARIEYITPDGNNFGTFLVSKANSNAATQAWRLISVRDNQYRILNLGTGLALGNNAAGLHFRMESPSTESPSQIWTLIPDWNQPTRFFVQGRGNVCLSFNPQGPVVGGGVRLRLAPCNTTLTNQLFTFPDPENSVWVYSSVEVPSIKL